MRCTSTVVAFLELTLVTACGGGAGAVPGVPSGVESTDDDALAQLAWLAGRWRQVDGDDVTLEAWAPPHEGVMYGVAITTNQTGVVHHELIRLEVVDGRVVYVASPAGQATARFAASRVEQGRVVFENSAHDFPKRIEYVLTGDAMTATVSGGPGERTASWSYERQPPTPSMAEVRGRVCVDASGRVTVTLSPCFCSARVYCAGESRDESLDLQIAVHDHSCDACSEAEGGCVAAHTSAVRVHGVEIPASGAGCFDGTFPVVAVVD